MRKEALLFVAASALLAQQPATPEQQAPGRVSGSVIDVTTQAPLPRVMVRIEASDDDSITVTTDAEGKFDFENVTPGRYGVRLTRNQYVATDMRSSPAIRQDGVLAVSPGQVIDDLVLGMEPAAVITGRVLDESGDPFEGLTVEAFRFRYRNGSREPRVWGSARSNDQGEYRIYGLYPGDYYLRVNTHPFLTRGATAREEVAPGYSDTYYPSGNDASRARPLRLTGQAETSGIDFRMTPTRTFHISGQVIDGATGRPSADTAAFLFDRTHTGSQLPISGRLIPVRGEDGRFRADSVIAGSYRLEVMTTSTAGTSRTAYYDFDLSDRSLEDVLIETRPIFSVPLVVTIEGESERPAGSPPLRLEPTGSYSVFRAVGPRAAEDGELHFASVSADLYRVRAGNLSGLYLKSARYGGRDALREFVQVEEDGGELEVVLSANGAQLDGQISRDGEAALGVRVVAVPDDRQRQDLYKAGATDQFGAFTLTDITPGRYKVFAWEDIENSAWLDPQVIADAEVQGVRVELEEGDAKRVTPKLIEAKD